MSIEQAFQKVEKFGRKPAEYLAFAVAVDIIFPCNSARDYVY